MLIKHYFLLRKNIAQTKVALRKRYLDSAVLRKRHIKVVYSI